MPPRMSLLALSKAVSADGGLIGLGIEVNKFVEQS